MPTKITQTDDLSERERRALADALEEVRQRRTAGRLRRLLAEAASTMQREADRMRQGRAP
jgi:hypothetical protein